MLGYNELVCKKLRYIIQLQYFDELLQNGFLFCYIENGYDFVMYYYKREEELGYFYIRYIVEDGQNRR